MTDVELLAQLMPRQVAGLTVYGESRNQPLAGKVAVAWVIRNRRDLGRYGASIKTICLRPKQFSCWNHDDRNYPLLIGAGKTLYRGGPLGSVLEDCFTAVATVLGDEIEDPTHTATHYLTRTCFAQAPPSWLHGKTPCYEIGDHVFFNDIDAPAPKREVA